MVKKDFLIWMSILIIGIVLTIPYAWYLIKVIFAGGNIFHQLEIFKWVATGFVVFAILRRYIKSNLEFAETFSHELTHAILAFLFNLQVVEFHANQDTGYMMTAQRNVYKGAPISLAPYCFPLFTFILLSFRWMMNFLTSTLPPLAPLHPQMIPRNIMSIRPTLARQTGIPTSKAGLERKIGKTIIKGIWEK